MDTKLMSLEPEFAFKYQELLDDCKANGFEFRPFRVLATPLEQANLWRQSRTKEEISAKIKELNKAGAKYLASVIDQVGPQSGIHVTNSIPGLSWHQWGLACDSVLIENKSAVWLSDHPGYEYYAKTANKMGLTAGLYFKFRDAVHIQYNKLEVLGVYSMKDVDKEMSKRFSTN